MFRLLSRLVDARELRVLLGGYVLTALCQGLTLAALLPFLRQLLTGGPHLGLWTGLVVAGGALSFALSTSVMIRSYRISVYDVCDALIGRIGEHVLRLPLGWFTAEREAQVAAAVSRDINTLSHIASMVLPALCSAVIVPAVMTVTVLVVDWQLGLVLLACAVPLALSWRLTVRRAEQVNTVEEQAAQHSAGRLIEFARLQSVLRATGHAERDWSPLTQALRAEDEAVRASLRAKGRPGAAFQLLVQAACALTLALATAQLLGKQLDVAAFLAIAAIATRTTGPLATAVLFATEANNAKVALRSVSDIMDSRPLPEPATPVQPQGTDITLRNVSFGYRADRPILDDISFTAQAGSITALVGPSGIGKSTLLRLAARFWDTDTGQVLVGGADVRDVTTTDLMALISLVFQDVYLFDTTIRENLRVARPDATDAELAAAARAARLDQVIASLPDGWQTRVGPGGLRLSGGERQRVSIARAFLKDAPILLLDEITSALDGENEAAITEVLAELAVGRTVIVVAHRLTTLRGADQILVLEGGPRGARICEQGTPAQLAAAGGRYADYLAASTDAARWQLRGSAAD
ncbi:ABC transporter ATP-binding protein [Buchananella hordeovulneris]|uniref:ABC transporter ATP-binding protein n=1 Tax=Buchananella hordeovulneris TaxID=52770 RepID=A0A1Q5PWU2_9ACTO|nr:ABC transporter ATP-binding protein [Buchananella hordeovulneris]OKL51885.1 ABC transporter ATP-binding protein [Buchananella hordeovulneris]